MVNGTENSYGFFGDIGMNSTDLAIVGIIVSVVVGLLVFGLDVRRNHRIDKDHKKIIKSNMDELQEIVTQMMLDVNELEKDEEMISERLNKFLIRNYNQIEFIINNIKVHHAQCSKLSDKEEQNISNTMKVTRWILDKYSPQDVPEEKRANLWKRHTTELKSQATILSNSITNFIN